MANGLPINNSSVFGGLGTATFTATAANAGPTVVSVKSFIPYAASGGSANSATAAGSSLSIVVNLNGSPILSLTSPGATQPLVGGKVYTSTVSGDVITVVMSSAAAIDNQPNAIKTMINIYQGV